jgi:prepilin-type N-terminal cleavage/methylation domain-containing protein
VHHLQRRRHAFTLIELLIVVMIAVILLAVALPTVKYGIEEGKLREASRTINATFAAARARAAATGRSAGVWLALEKVGDPAGATHTCTQLFLAEVPEPYSGDVLNAKALVGTATTTSIPPLPPTPNASELAPWRIRFPGSPGAYSLFEVNQDFAIRFDFKGDLYFGRTLNIPNYDDDDDGTQDETGEFGFWLYGRAGADGQYGKAGVDDDNDGSTDADMTGPDRDEYGAPGSDDVIFLPPTAVNATGGYTFQLYRAPERVGEPIDLPRGVVIDIDHCGRGATDRFIDRPFAQRPAGFILILFAPSGGVSSVTFGQVNPALGMAGYTDATTLHLLVGRPDKLVLNVPNPQLVVADTNLADSTALWVSISRRTGSVTTTDNAPSFNPQDFNPPQPFPPTTVQQVRNFVERAREFATGGESKGGQ